MTDDQQEFPDIDENSVTVERVGDYMVELDVDGLPRASVAIDYYEDQPRVLVTAHDVVTDFESDEQATCIVTPNRISHEHTGHDVEPYAIAREVTAPKIHEGIYWCHDCDEEFVPDDDRPARTQ